WQNIDQIARNFGKEAVATFIGSSQVRQFFGVRDFSTARLISDMLGTQTLEFDDILAQEKAVLNRKQIARQLFTGGDPFEAALNIKYHNLAAQHRTKQARALMTPDEIMNMPEDRQILFISGLNLAPIFAHKQAYYTRCDLAGAYLPNPYHKPTDRVRIATRFGTRWLPVITEPVPEKHAHLPQYQRGKWTFIKGYRPY
ncbi:MAG TPA: type IV secretory system conjugative DNA transfer family protein, partial [Spongiibacteraceae bacterium]